MICLEYLSCSFVHEELDYFHYTCSCRENGHCAFVGARFTGMVWDPLAPLVTLVSVSVNNGFWHTAVGFHEGNWTLNPLLPFQGAHP